MSESTTQESAIQAPREWFDGTWFEGVNAGLNGSKRLIESSYVATFGQC